MRESEAPPAGTLLEKIRDGCAAHPRWTLALVTLAALLPFLAKPFNMDDPCYVWAAQHIQSHPENPYDFQVNWSGVTQPMWRVTQNPPLFSYYLALAAGLFGWSEIGMHLACLLPAVATVLGTHRLAKTLCRRPMLAALLTLFVPGFLVSATTVMCDVPMLALWVWAVVFWTEGLGENRFAKLAAAGTLAALALLTKYNGACLIPLLAAYGYGVRRSGRWWLFLLIPVVAFLAYQGVTLRLYGQGLFSAAATYSQNERDIYGISKAATAFNALIFTGGCFAGALFYAPFLWRRRELVRLAAGSGLLTILFLTTGLIAKNYGWLHGGVRWGVEAQIFLWSAGGVFALALAVVELWQKRDAPAWLLALWVGGIFVFAIFFNWTVNARSLLPMAPAVAILIFRRLERSRSEWSGAIHFPLIASAILCLLAAQADFQQAGAARNAAQRICAQAATATGRLWFEGHWGFQYYMQAAGAWPVDSSRLKLVPGDRVVVPDQNSNAEPLPAKIATLEQLLAVAAFPWLTTLNTQAGAGFYSDRWGPLPFAFGIIPPEKFYVYVLKNPEENPR